MPSPRTAEVEGSEVVKVQDAAEVTAERGPGYTDEEVARGDYPPILSLLSPELAAEVAAMKIGGEPLYTPRLRVVKNPRAA
jgi:hypothetical protein